MGEKKLAELPDAELLKEAKRMKSHHIYDALIFGFLLGVAIYGSVKNGFGLLTFLPLFYLPIAKKNKDKKAEIGRLLKERNLD